MPSMILIEDIENAKDKTIRFKVEDVIDGIISNGPLSADLTARSLGEFIEISGNVKGIVKLECDLCLKEFDYQLDFDIDEMFAKRALLDDYGQETELKDGQFVTDLNGEDKIDIYDLLYQSVILQLPNKKVCGINCKEDFFEKDDSFKVHDERMDIFKTIKIEK